MQNFEYCQYTYRHRRAFEYLVNKLFPHDTPAYQIMIMRARRHDLDKLIMYQCTSKEEASKIHKATSSHHVHNDKVHDYYDKLEAVLDYECAGYTKPDKPLNAWDTILRFQQQGANPTLCEQMLAICRQYGLDGSYRVTETDPDGATYLKKYDIVTEEMIQEDIVAYFRGNTPN